MSDAFLGGDTRDLSPPGIKLGILLFQSWEVRLLGECVNYYTMEPLLSQPLHTEKGEWQMYEDKC